MMILLISPIPSFISSILFCIDFFAQVYVGRGTQNKNPFHLCHQNLHQLTLSKPKGKWGATHLWSSYYSEARQHHTRMYSEFVAYISTSLLLFSLWINLIVGPGLVGGGRIMKASDEHKIYYVEYIKNICKSLFYCLIWPYDIVKIDSLCFAIAGTSLL